MDKYTIIGSCTVLSYTERACACSYDNNTIIFRAVVYLLFGII